MVSNKTQLENFDKEIYKLCEGHNYQFIEESFKSILYMLRENAIIDVSQLVK